eukprot:TRINITY_DN73140_c0_g1_i1.p1 TRINITY_DN73140_c0_g1~~TRINITY_DN73140_c0_g1_i1.p1  ORF type:complete len:309 (-),score=56.19 TRINITY_DN73140_c0_g1_i1:95-1021(-)
MGMSAKSVFLGLAALVICCSFFAFAHLESSTDCSGGERCADGTGQEEADVGSLLQVRNLSATQTSGSVKIVVKAPPKGNLPPAEEAAATCASLFNAAFAACLGSTNAYLMHIYTEGNNAYCGYDGGWTLQPSANIYKNPAACAVSPGQEKPLFFDPTAKTLTTFDKTVVVKGVTKYTGGAFSCYDKPNHGPECTSRVVAKDRRNVIIHAKPQALLPGPDKVLEWTPSAGYVGIETIQGNTISVMYVKNLDAGNGLSNAIPCGQKGSVDEQVRSFPVRGVSGGCANQQQDYYVLFNSKEVTICFPGSAC